jgi:hypothetical protein
MGKNKKKNKKNDVEMIDSDVEMFADAGYEDESPVPYPEKFDNQVLISMNDDELHKLGRSLDDSISRVSKMNLNPYPWEIELCYVQQEMQLRSMRRSAHSEWLSKLPPAEME